MQKFLLIIFLLIILVSCTNQYMENMTTKENANEYCMDMKYFKIFQVFDENYALAKECDFSTEQYCYGPVVLLTPQRGIDYYDDMHVGLPKNKCAIQDGTFQYETKSKNTKTVPIIRWEYKYEPESKEEALFRLEEKLDELKGECKLLYSSNKKTNTKAILNRCDCSFDEMLKGYKVEMVKEQDEIFDFEKFTQELARKVEKKCGKLPELEQ